MTLKKVCNGSSRDGTPCVRPVRARGLCSSHYIGAYRKGLLPPTHRQVLVRVKFYLPREHDRALRRIQKASGEKYAELLRSAVQMFIDSRPK